VATTLFKLLEDAVISTLSQALSGKKQVINRERYLRAMGANAGEMPP
jgi:hypothetical protein